MINQYCLNLLIFQKDKSIMHGKYVELLLRKSEHEDLRFFSVIFKEVITWLKRKQTTTWKQNVWEN